jgi:hypothetical protein
MLKKFCSKFISAIRSDNKSCPPISLYNLPAKSLPQDEFESHCCNHGNLPIYHITDYDSAVGIITKKTIYGVDVVSSAHFHISPQLAFPQASKEGVILGFSWSGQLKKSAASRNDTTHSDRTPNILFDIKVNGPTSDTWELRIYPPTYKDLELQWIGFGSESRLLISPLVIAVLHSDNMEDN